MKSNGKKL